MKDFFEKTNLSPIEVAKGLHVLKSLSGSKAEFESIQQHVLPEGSAARVAQVIHGLDQEDEFAVLCRLMGTCNSIAKIGQSPIVDSDEIAPDFIASFSPGSTALGKTKKDLGLFYQCFIEVKSCRKNTFSISKKDLTRRRNFAKRYRLPLIFAVRFTGFENHGFWVMMDTEQMKERGRKISVTDMVGNLNPILLDDFGLTTNPGLHVAHWYDKRADAKGVHDPKFGPLVKTAILLPDKDPYVVPEVGHILVNAFLDGYHQEPIQTEESGPVTCVVSKIGFQNTFLSDALFRINRVAVDSNGDVHFDASRVVASLDKKDDPPPLITRDMLAMVFNILNEGGSALFVLGMGDLEETEKTIHRLSAEQPGT